jgi:uncharacterized membrane protein
MALVVRFLAYGLLGWAIEIVWSALHRALRRELPTPERWRLAGTTYLWMFPIYGSLVFLYEPLHDALRGTLWPLRAAVYAAGFLAVEYAAGWLLRRLTGACPWDYAGRARWQVHGLIRLDYGPAWALLGLALEPVHDFLLRLTPWVLRSL